MNNKSVIGVNESPCVNGQEICRGKMQSNKTVTDYFKASSYFAVPLHDCCLSFTGCYFPLFCMTVVFFWIRVVCIYAFTILHVRLSMTVICLYLTADCLYLIILLVALAWLLAALAWLLISLAWLLAALAWLLVALAW